MATYLLTGSAGFIGAGVAELLLSNGHTVVGVDKLDDAYDTRLKRWRLDQLEGRDRFTFHRLDICDRPGLRKILDSNYDAVINLAARAGVRHSVENPWVYFETNVTGTLNLLEACKEFGIGKFVLASTSSVYGEDTPQPFAEDSQTSRPLSPYASSKKAAEALAYTYHHLHGLDVTVLRFFTVYGPAGRPDMVIFRFIRSIAEGEVITVFGDGKQERDFTYVEDVARGTVAAVKPFGYEIVNLGSDRPAVLADVISLIETTLGKEARIEYATRHSADVLSTRADIRRAHSLLGWRPQVSLEEGIKYAVRWYEQNRSWARDIK